MAASSKNVSDDHENLEDGASEASGGNDASVELDEVRNILFGAQIRATEDALATLRAQFSEQLAALEAHSAQTIAQLNDRLEAHKAQFEKTLEHDREATDQRAKDLASHIDAQIDAVNSEHQAYAANAKKAQGKFEARHKKDNSSVNSRIDHVHKTLDDQLQAAVQDLDTRKTDRAALASLLKKMADSLDTD